MRTPRLAAVLFALPLLAFDCGGKDEGNPMGACRLEVRGGANEDLWCVVAAYDYSDLDPANTMWAFELAAYRGTQEVAGGVGLFHDGRPSLGAPYGWSGGTSNVDSGSAMRDVAMTTTHEAWSPLQGVGGTGAISVTFTKIPAKGATGPALMDVHGTLTGTLPAVDGVGGPVTFQATF